MSTVELIAIGREILDGRVIDTNSVVIAEALRTLGLVPRFAQRVDDDHNRILQAFEVAKSRSQIVLVTGGLGPTSDDITAEVFASFLGEKCVLNEVALKQIEARFAFAQIPMREVQKKQAFLPPSCFILKNNQGTAPGFAFEAAPNQFWYFMPGVPLEMKAMLHDEILPRLERHTKQINVKHFSMTWATQFTSEGMLQEQLTPVEKKLIPGFEITYRTRFPENHIGLYAACAGEDHERLFQELAQEITRILGDKVFAISKDLAPLKSLEEVVVDVLKEKKFVLTTVESCTGGLIANRVTNVSGSSAVFSGGFVVYDNSMKNQVLNVDQEALKKFGAVSAEVAALLAENGLKKSESILSSTLDSLVWLQKDRQGLVCVATTGIAGPGGGTPAKPVGLCYLGIAMSGQPVRVEEIRARPGLDRTLVKTFFAQKALDLVWRALLSQCESSSS